MLSEEGDVSKKLRNVDNTAAANRPATDSEYIDVARTRRSSVEERFASKMVLSYSREITYFFVAIVVGLGLGALHSVPPRVSRPPVARPFFNQSSVILDFYKGHLDAMLEQVVDSDLSFVMYYAPWDAECQAARHEFENVARYYYSRIFFAAINCWHPGSECRLQYSKIQSYPVLILYSSRDNGIQYRGIIGAPYIMRFLDSFVKPIERITSRQQLAQLVVENDAVVVGFVDFKGLSVSPGYKEFYRAATRFLEEDPNRDVAFAIVTDSTTAGNEFGVQNFPSASLSMWNETLIYPSDKLFTSKNLLKWIGNEVHKVALWLQPPGVKSLTLAPYLRDGPVLFLFTPRNPLHRSNYNFYLLKQIALEYYSCGGTPPTNDLIDSLREIISNASVAHRERTKSCSSIVNESKIQAIVPRVSVSVQQWINDSCCAKIVMNKCLLCKKSFPDVSLTNVEPDVCGLSENDAQLICKDSDVFKTTKKIVTDDCCDENRSWNGRSTFVGQSSNFGNKKTDAEKLAEGEEDRRSTKVVRKIFIKDLCTKLLAGNKYHNHIFPDNSRSADGAARKAVTGCEVNKTLAFIAIDSFQYFHFAEGLGIDLLRAKDKTAVVILDSDQESQYLMKKNLNEDSLTEFVNSYTNGLLERTLRSDSSRRFARNVKISDGCEGVKDGEICVPELTTDTFFKVVMDPTIDVVVMYHTPYCAFCSAVAYVYLTVAKYLDKMENLAFVRIDGENNDLPWEYSMNRYPSILFFPAKRKEDSTVYPFSLPVTVRNFLSFVLANLDGDSHVEALVNICRLGSGESPLDCVVRTRRLCLDVIENLLRQYRKLRRNSVDGITSSNKRREILTKLNHIRDVHLILSSVENFQTDDEKFYLVERKFKDYHRNLRALDDRRNSRTKNRKIHRKKWKSDEYGRPEVVASVDKVPKDEL